MFDGGMLMFRLLGGVRLILFGVNWGLWVMVGVNFLVVIRGFWRFWWEFFGG